MANSINITFTQPAQVEDTIGFKTTFYIDGIAYLSLGGNRFKTSRTYPGEVAIGTDANSQALLYYNAFIIDYGMSYIVSILANVVTITSINNDFISDFTTTGSTFTTAIIGPAVPVINTWFTSPYPNDKKAFTLDQKFFELSTDNSNTYFQFNTSIKTFNFFTNEEKIYTLNQKKVPFKGKSKVNIGQLIHRLMSKFTEVNSTFLQYRYAEVNVNCSELNLNNLSIIRTYVPPTFQFVAGLGRAISTHGFLEFNPKPNRVTQKSFAYLNILIPIGTYELRTFKNGTLIYSEALPTNTYTTLCKKVLFDTYNQGDVIEYVIDIVGENNTDAPKKIFCVFPNSNYSNMIVWENEFKMQSAIECTGSASLDPDLEFQSQKVYQNLVETLEHLSSSKDVKLYIDTGWLLFTDIDTIESVMRSKRAWLIQGDKQISLRPIGKQLPKQDYENELISFPLEFTINRAYDEETYTL
jgi:hypothetical protein